MTRYLCALMVLVCFVLVGCTADETEEPKSTAAPAGTNTVDEPAVME